MEIGRTCILNAENRDKGVRPKWNFQFKWRDDFLRFQPTQIIQIKKYEDYFKQKSFFELWNFYSFMVSTTILISI